MIPSVLKKKGIRVDIIERYPEKERKMKVNMKSKQELKEEAWEAYLKALAPALEAYLKATEPAWKAYEKATAPAWKKACEKAREPALEAYLKATEPAWKAYEKATEPAREAYKKRLKEIEAMA